MLYPPLPVSGDALQTPFPELTVMFWRLKAHLAQLPQSQEATEHSISSLYYLFYGIVQFGVHWHDNFVAPIVDGIGDRLLQVFLSAEVRSEMRAREKIEIDLIFSEIIQNPFCEIPLHIHQILADFDTDKAANRLFSFYNKDDLSLFSVDKWIVEAVVAEEVDIDGAIRRMLDLLVGDEWKLASSCDCPPEFQPLYLPEFTVRFPYLEGFGHDNACEDEPDEPIEHDFQTEKKKIVMK